MLRQVNPYDDELLPVEQSALIKMLRKREQYVEQGRAGEAHGAGTMIWILWNELKADYHDTMPTDWTIL
jgi:hypothetical protein